MCLVRIFTPKVPKSLTDKNYCLQLDTIKIIEHYGILKNKFLKELIINRTFCNPHFHLSRLIEKSALYNLSVDSLIPPGPEKGLCREAIDNSSQDERYQAFQVSSLTTVVIRSRISLGMRDISWDAV